MSYDDEGGRHTEDRPFYDGESYFDLRRDDRFEVLSWVERDFFYGLLTVSNEDGWFEVQEEVLRSMLYPLRMKRVKLSLVRPMLNRLVEVGLLKLCMYEGRECGQLQRVGGPLPPPPDWNPDEG